MHSGKLPQIEKEKFLEVVRQAIQAGRHADYLRRVLENFSWYEKMFQGVFASDGAPEAIYLFRITYENKPNVWRDIEIRGDQHFEHLAKKIVSTMGWRYDHLHGFTFPGMEKEAKGDIDIEGRTELSFFHPDWEDEPFPTYKSNRIRIHQVDYRKFPRLEFIFDYGDEHAFVIDYKGQRAPGKADQGTKSPKLVDQRGVAPEQYPSIEEGSNADEA